MSPTPLRVSKFSSRIAAATAAQQQLRKSSAGYISELEKFANDPLKQKEKHFPKELLTKQANLFLIWQQDLVQQYTENQDDFQAGRITFEEFSKQREALTIIRKISAENELEMLSNKQYHLDDLDALRPVNTKSYQELITHVLSAYSEENWRIPNRIRALKKPKLSVINKQGRTVSWRQHLAAEYKGSKKLSPDFDPNGPPATSDDYLYWCCILHMWIEPDKVRAAHIVPRSTKDSHLALLFRTSDSESFLMNSRNGILMHKNLEEAFDAGMFIIAPNGKHDDQDREEYECRIIRDDFLPEKGGTKRQVRARVGVLNQARIWLHDIHHKVVQFPPECDLRPAKRCLFHHSLVSILLAKSHQLKGWQDAMSEFVLKPGNVWASPGDYLNHSVLEAAWECLHNEELPEALKDITFRKVSQLYSPLPKPERPCTPDSSRRSTLPAADPEKVRKASLEFCLSLDERNIEPFRKEGDCSEPADGGADDDGPEDSSEESDEEDLSS
jgi:hypothetical protein